MSRTWRICLTLATTTILLGSIGFALWRADWRYSLPTPRPATLVQPDALDPATLARLRAAAGAKADQPLLVHFYNRDCPCSRFNSEHVLELVREFGSRLAQLELLELPADEKPGASRRDEELELPLLAENDGRLARALGVYSTPQAVLIDGAGHVFYRGNYNQSRYCTRPDTAFAEQASAALLAGRPCPPMPAAARVAYGCELPNGAWGPGRP